MRVEEKETTYRATGVLPIYRIVRELLPFISVALLLVLICRDCARSESSRARRDLLEDSEMSAAKLALDNARRLTSSRLQTIWVLLNGPDVRYVVEGVDSWRDIVDDESILLAIIGNPTISYSPHDIVDGWGHEFRFLRDEFEKVSQIFSVGPDGMAGTPDDIVYAGVFD